MCKVHNSHLDKAGQTRRLPGVKNQTNDPHGEIKTPAKQIIKRNCAKENKKRTNEECVNIKGAFKHEALLNTGDI